MSRGLTVPKELDMVPRSIFNDPGDKPKFYDQIAWFEHGSSRLLELTYTGSAGCVAFPEAVMPDLTRAQLSYGSRITSPCGPSSACDGLVEQEDRVADAAGEVDVGDRDFVTAEPHSGAGWSNLVLPFALVLAMIAASVYVLDRQSFGISWGLWLATLLAAVPIVTFFGLFAATRDVRIAISGSFVVLYFTLLAHLLLASSLRDNLDTEFGKSVLTTFTTMVTTVLAFYVGGEAAVKGAKVVQEQKSKQAEEKTKQEEQKTKQAELTVT